MLQAVGGGGPETRPSGGRTSMRKPMRRATVLASPVLVCSGKDAKGRSLAKHGREGQVMMMMMADDAFVLSSTPDTSQVSSSSTRIALKKHRRPVTTAQVSKTATIGARGRKPVVGDTMARSTAQPVCLEWLQHDEGPAGAWRDPSEAPQDTGTGTCVAGTAKDDVADGTLKRTTRWPSFDTDASGRSTAVSSVGSEAAVVSGGEGGKQVRADGHDTRPVARSKHGIDMLAAAATATATVTAASTADHPRPHETKTTASPSAAPSPSAEAMSSDSSGTVSPEDGRGRRQHHHGSSAPAPRAGGRRATRINTRIKRLPRGATGRSNGSRGVKRRMRLRLAKPRVLNTKGTSSSIEASALGHNPPPTPLLTSAPHPAVPASTPGARRNQGPAHTIATPSSAATAAGPGNATPTPAPPRRFTSTFHGVSWHKRSQRWAVQIRHNGKRVHVGYFTKESDAALAYDAVATELRGARARLNFDIDGRRTGIKRRRQQQARLVPPVATGARHAVVPPSPILGGRVPIQDWNGRTGSPDAKKQCKVASEGGEGSAAEGRTWSVQSHRDRSESGSSGGSSSASSSASGGINVTAITRKSSINSAPQGLPSATDTKIGGDDGSGNQPLQRRCDAADYFRNRRASDLHRQRQAGGLASCASILLHRATSTPPAWSRHRRKTGRTRAWSKRRGKKTAGCGDSKVASGDRDDSSDPDMLLVSSSSSDEEATPGTSQPPPPPPPPRASQRAVSAPSTLSTLVAATTLVLP